MTRHTTIKASKMQKNLIAISGIVTLLIAEAASAALPFSEEFDTDTFKDLSNTTALWDKAGVDSDSDDGVVKMGESSCTGGITAIDPSCSTVDRNRFIHSDQSDTDFNALLVSAGITATGIAVGDLNNDTFLDIVFVGASSGIIVLLNTTGSDLTDYDLRSVSVGTSNAVALGDIDGDGDLDIVVANTGINNWYRNFGGHTYSLQPIGSSLLTSVAVALGDVDHDGDLDIVFGNTLDTNNLYYNDGSGGFGDAVAIGSETDDTTDIVLANLDSDGYLDVAVANMSLPNRVYINSQDTAALFDTVTDIGSDSVLVDTRGSSTSIAIGDLDQDNHNDIIIGNTALENNRYYLNSGDGTFGTGNNLFNSTDGSSPYNTIDIAIFDASFDGYVDAMTVNENDNNLLYRWHQNGGFQVPGPVGSSTTSTAVAMGDLDNNTTIDASFTSSTASPTYIPSEGFSAAYSNNAGFVPHFGKVQSTTINEGETIYAAQLTVVTSAANVDKGTSNTSINYYMSNDGGSQWYQVYPDIPFVFPNGGGSDLRWKAELKTITHILSPTLGEIYISANMPPTAQDSTHTVSPLEILAIPFASIGYSDPEGSSISHVTLTSVPATGTLWIDSNGNGVLDGTESALSDGSEVSAADYDFTGTANIAFIGDAIGSISIGFRVNDGLLDSVDENTISVAVAVEDLSIITALTATGSMHPFMLALMLMLFVLKIARRYK